MIKFRNFRSNSEKVMNKFSGNFLSNLENNWTNFKIFLLNPGNFGILWPNSEKFINGYLGSFWSNLESLWINFIIFWLNTWKYLQQILEIFLQIWYILIWFWKFQSNSGKCWKDSKKFLTQFVKTVYLIKFSGNC